MKLFKHDTQAIIYGKQGKSAQGMLDFDYVSKRETPSVACFVDPKRSGIETPFFGKSEILVPVYKRIQEAVKKHPNATVMISFAPARLVYATTLEALNTNTIKTIVIIAEGVPERETRILTSLARKKGKVIIGPATVGGVVAGKFKIGNSGGTTENIINSKLYRHGSVGLVTKSGGMLNELFNMIARNSDGVYEGIAIGGDRYPSSSLIDHLLRYEENDEIKFHVMLGEVGGLEEYKVIEALKQGKIKKPLVAWVTGTCAKIFPTEVQFGHAGARAGGAKETADAKNAALREAGAIVPDSFDELPEEIRKVYENLKQKGIIDEPQEFTPPKIPMDYKVAMQKGLVRRHSEFVSTISYERGELKYAGIPISQLIEEDRGIGYIIGLLWLKRKLPEYASKFLELDLKLMADHGPCVSATHTAIVMTRAGKDLVSSVAAGLLPIGPRFGGAPMDAARGFKWGIDSGFTPQEFVEEMKKRGKPIPGIGHKIKKVKGSDMRMTIFIDYARKNFPTTECLDYALEVEKITSAKRSYLILNIAACLGTLAVDLLKSLGFTNEEIDEKIEAGFPNTFFLVPRVIGIIGHIFDQKRLKTGLYRTPLDDVLYWLPDPKDL